jgi:hypothetical protein
MEGERCEMYKTILTKGIPPTVHFEKPFRLEQPVVVIPEEEYRELLADINDLRDALKAEEDYLSTGGKLFIEYDKERRKKRR